MEAALIGLTMVSGWLVATMAMSRRRASQEVGAARAREALVAFAERSLEIESAQGVLAFAGQAAEMIFGSRHAVAFEPGEEAGAWEAHVAGGETLAPVPAHLRGVFGWFRHNPVIAPEADLGQSRFGAMRAPLQQVMDGYGVDLLVPLVKGERVQAVLGLSLGRPPTELDRELMHLFRLQSTAACANVRLHREAAHIVSLAQELDLASSVELALVPASPEGARGGVSWAGHFESAGEAASDFWGAYELEDGRVAFIVGDAIGSGLAGSMISAVVKSCADVIFEDPPSDLGPGRLLAMLGRALRQRTESSGQTSCFAAFFDPASGEVAYSNAAHPAPYVVEDDDGALSLGTLSRPGPLLGDTADATYPVGRRKLTPGAQVVLYTDGLVGGAGNTRAGDRRLQRLLRRTPTDTAAELRDAISRDAREARAGAAPRDDAALVVVRLDVAT